MKASSHVPLATYRLQLNRDFTFNQATEVIPYLSGLGISHCYVSPCLKARPGSLHGYDIVDHNSLNPEIGTTEDFDRFVTTLHEHGMGLILDIVPNHMGVMGSDNAWWLDVLENGQSSVYAGFFDIDWNPSKDELQGKVLVPALHDHYGAVLESGELKLVFYPERGEFDVVYRQHRFPVDPKEYLQILQRCGDSLADKLGAQSPDLLEFQSLITAFKNLPGRDEASSERTAERNRDKEIHKRRLAELCLRSPAIGAHIARAVALINGDPSDPASFDALHELIKAQTFRLANWRVASDDINYRRFFDINDLAGLRMENENVFEATHRFVFQLMSEGKIDGLRVDHPDGLYDPDQYFERLKRGIALATSKSQNGGNESRYVVIEKILTGPERLPGEWPVCGTTGYDFANLVNGLFVNPATAKPLERVYGNFVGEKIDFQQLSYDCRKLIIRVALASELNVLANQLSRIALSKRHTCDFTLNGLRDALTEVVASFPVYRTYIRPAAILERDATYIGAAIASAKWRSSAADTSIFDFVGNVLLTRIAHGQDAAYGNAVTAFAMKFQQFTSPVMAKGVEDTTFYRYNRLVSLNDVGNDLLRFGTTTAEFHHANLERRRDWPDTMLATSTHDSKRSEDIRARIAVLSETPAVWRLRVSTWKRFNRSHKRVAAAKLAPSLNDEYLLYQTLLGAWPLEPLNDADWKIFSERIENYMLKAIREAKTRTSWINRNAEYETAVSSFVKTLLSRKSKNRFLDDFVPFQRRIARIGLWNSLSQTLLKLTCPGVPDIYQGNDLWDFSLVDPDNRRPIDYAHRKQMLASMDGLVSGMSRESEARSLGPLLETPEDGRLKLYLIWRTLCLRQREPELFQRGEYLPLEVQGDKANHVIAFARKSETTCAVVIVPRLIASLLNDAALPPIGSDVWGDTRVLLAASRSGTSYGNVLTKKIADMRKVDEHLEIDVSKVLGEFPVAVLVAAPGRFPPRTS
jgi:(1->4)-alpha-D-glucan 1-alpha-D-glucosylmutase